MNSPIESVQLVSDGILVRFGDGLITYYPQGFLRDHIGRGSNQVFLDHDPCIDGPGSGDLRVH